MSYSPDLSKPLVTITLNKRVNFGWFKLPRGCSMTGRIVKRYPCESPCLDDPTQTEIVERFDFATDDGCRFHGISFRSIEAAETSTADLNAG